MKKLFVLLLLCSSQFVSGQTITDTAALRNYINTWVLPNGTRVITAKNLNTIFNGFLNTVPKPIDSVRFFKIGDTLKMGKAGRILIDTGGYVRAISGNKRNTNNAEPGIFTVITLNDSNLNVNNPPYNIWSQREDNDYINNSDARHSSNWFIHGVHPRAGATVKVGNRFFNGYGGRNSVVFSQRMYWMGNNGQVLTPNGSFEEPASIFSGEVRFWGEGASTGVKSTAKAIGTAVFTGGLQFNTTNVDTLGWHATFKDMGYYQGSAWVNDYYGIWLRGSSSTTIGRRWGVYQQHASDNNFFNGNVWIGDTARVNTAAYKLYTTGKAKITDALYAARAVLGYAVDDGTSVLQANGTAKLDSLVLTNKGWITLGLADPLGYPGYGGVLYGNTFFGQLSFDLERASNRAGGSIQNTAFGFRSLQNAWNAQQNAAFGFYALQGLTSGIANSGFGGRGALQSVTTGNYNTGFGSYTGGVTTGSNNTFVGYSANTTNTALENTTVIGANVQENRSNAVKIGKSTQTIFNIGVTLSEYADNAAALAAGLVIGDLYRTGDVLKVVH